MFNGLKKIFASGSRVQPAPLSFRDAQAALQFACESLQCDLAAGEILPALVPDATIALGADSPVVRLETGTQMVALRVASKDGGFLVLAGTLSSSGPSLASGDLVAWQAGKTMPRETAQLTKDARSRWVGIVLAKLRPEYTSGRGWAIAEPFRP